METVTLEALTLSRTEVTLEAGEPFQLTAAPTPSDAQVTVTWTSSDPDIATVDEYGNIANVYKGSNQVSVTITASAGGQTATCTVTCTGDGTGEDIVPSGGASTGGQTGGALAPNTDAVITGATGGLNIRSGPGSDYEKVAARVIGKDPGNWFSTFQIDKGSNDGITKDMNVIADGGLAGIVTDVGPNYATVRAVIDDNSNVSCKDLATSNLCIVSGSLQSMNESSMIHFSDLSDKENKVAEGDQIVTSNVSDLYLEGIPVGYITEITDDANQLTKSGKVATIVDFEHMEKVFVILQTKDAITEHQGE